MFAKRIAALQQKMSKLKADAILIMSPDNVYYFSGYTGTSGYAVITQDTIQLLTDFRYLEQASSQSAHCEIIDIGNDLYIVLKKLLASAKNIYFEEDYFTYKQYEKLQNTVTGELLPLAGTIEGLRRIKDEQELTYLRAAANMADEAFLHILKFIKPGVTELEVAVELEFFMRKKGSQGPSFEFIVASGQRGSMPHGVASDKKIASGELVTLDFGSIYQGYHSDITRTLAVGQPPADLQKIYNIVFKAQAESLAMVKAGMKCKDIDKIARDIISKEGFGDKFRHGLGHGVGLDIHEEPRFNTSDETVLDENMVMTIEPGIYIPGLGGVRIEDSVIVKQNGYELLTKVTKDLIIL